MKTTTIGVTDAGGYILGYTFLKGQRKMENKTTPQQIFNGRTYRRHRGQKYFTTGARKLHRDVWVYHFGEIPAGHQIHHKDGNPSNNEIDNLECLTVAEHVERHNTDEKRNRQRALMYKAHQNGMLKKAVEYHKSQIGREQSKRIFKQHGAKNLYIQKEFVCANCGVVYVGTHVGKNKYCSNNCKSTARRKSGVDNVVSHCERCGGEFIKNKYSPRRFCCRRCADENAKK